jgi:hypothetical protein
MLSLENRGRCVLVEKSRKARKLNALRSIFLRILMRGFSSDASSWKSKNKTHKIMPK